MAASKVCLVNATKPLVLVTGAMGVIAQKVIPKLAEVCDFRLIDREATTVNGHQVSAVDITDFAAVLKAVQGVDAVLHLAIASSRNFVTDEALFEADEGDEYLRFNQATIEVNLRGTYNVLEAARMAGVKRVIYGSSLTVLLGYSDLPKLSDHLTPKPSNFYAVTKLWGERLGEYFSRAHDLQFLSLRFGTPHPQSDHPKYERWLTDDLVRSTFVTYEDLAGAIRCALSSPRPAFGCYSITSAGEGSFVDTSAGQEIGWRSTEFCHIDGSITKVKL